MGSSHKLIRCPGCWQWLIFNCFGGESRHQAPFVRDNSLSQCRQGGSISGNAQPARKSNGFRNSLLLVLLTLVFVGIFFGLRSNSESFHWDLFLATFSQMNWWWFGGSVILVMLTYLGRAIRWQVMIRPIRPHSSLWNLFNATAIGFTAVVLFGRAGELVRPYLIATKEKVTFTSQLAVWLLERIYDLLSVLLLFGFALSQIHSSSTKIGTTMQTVLSIGGQSAGAMAMLCMAVLIVFGLFPKFVEVRLTQALKILPDRFQHKVAGFVRAFLEGTSSTRRGSFVIQLIAYTFAEWLLIVACFLCLFQAFPATKNLGVVDALIVVGFVAFGSAVQVPGVGGGMQVATVIVLTELFSVPLEIASGIAILIWFVTFVIVVPIGLILALRDGLQFRKLMNAEEIKSV